MRTTTLALACPLVLAVLAGCVDIPHRHYFDTDAGSGSGSSDAGGVPASCSDANFIAGDLNVSAADASSTISGVPKSGAWKLGGKLTISGGSVTSIAKLGQLCSVGDLEIAGTGLTHIDTPNAFAVVGNLSIHDNANLTDVANLVPGTDNMNAIDIEHNAKLASFTSFGSVAAVYNATTISNNGALATIDLHSVTRFEGGLDVEYDGALTSLELSSLQSVTGAFTLANNQELASLSIGQLQYVHGNLTIDSNAALDLGSLVAFDQIDGNLVITNNAHVQNLGQLAHTANVLGAIEISNNTQLGYCALREVGCCVRHTGTMQDSNNAGTNCSTPPNPHSWCYQANNNSCPYQYQ